jgi:hypothetical protein
MKTIQRCLVGLLGIAVILASVLGCNEDASNNDDSATNADSELADTRGYVIVDTGQTVCYDAIRIYNYARLVRDADS